MGNLLCGSDVTAVSRVLMSKRFEHFRMLLYTDYFSNVTMIRDLGRNDSFPYLTYSIVGYNGDIEETELEIIHILTFTHHSDVIGEVQLVVVIRCSDGKPLTVQTGSFSFN